MRRKRQRRPQLKRVAATLKKLSGRQVPQMSGEEQLRRQMHRHVRRAGRYGIDGVAVRAVGEVIESHVIEMRAEVLRQQAAEDAELGELDARLSGLAVKYREDELRQRGVVSDLHYQRRSAIRRVEDRDTPMPAGADGVEQPDGYQHGNVGALAGRGVRTRIILWIVLILAMTADLIALRQVIERVVNESFVSPMAVALTGTTTYLAHLAGELFKRAKRTDRSIRRAVGAWTLAGFWAAMGVGAFVFRLLAPPPISGDVVADFVNSGAATTGPAGDSPALSAMLLLFLYVLTGAVAVSAGYQRPRPEIEQYRRVNRALRKAEPRLAAIRRGVAEADALGKQLTDLRVGRWKLYAVEAERCRAASRRVQAEASMAIRRELRSGEVPWFRRILGRRMVPDEGHPVIEIIEPHQATDPHRADGAHDAGDGLDPPNAS